MQLDRMLGKSKYWGVKQWLSVLTAFALPLLLLSVWKGAREPIWFVLPLAPILIGLAGLSVMRNRMFAFAAILVLNENVLYLFNRDWLVYVYDMKQLVGVMMLGITVLFLGDVLTMPMRFKKHLAILGIYQIISVLNATFNLNQPLMKSIYSEFMNMLYLGYFVFMILEGGETGFRERMERTIIIIATIGSIFYFAQFLVYDSFVFLDADFRYRYDTIRFSEPSMLLAISCFLTFEQILKGRGKQLVWLLGSFALQMFYHIMISKGRMVLIGLILSFAAVMMIQRRIRMQLLMFFLVLGMLVVSTWMLSNYESTQVQVTEEASDEGLISSITEVTEQSGNFGVRTDAIRYYRLHMDGHLLLGQGIINQDHSKSYFVTGRNLEYYIVDVGLFGYVFEYGLIGLALMLLLIIRGIAAAVQGYRKDPTMVALVGYFVLIFTTSATVFFPQEPGAMLYIALALALADMRLREQIEAPAALLLKEEHIA